MPMDSNMVAEEVMQDEKPVRARQQCSHHRCTKFDHRSYTDVGPSTEPIQTPWNIIDFRWLSITNSPYFCYQLQNSLHISKLFARVWRTSCCSLQTVFFGEWKSSISPYSTSCELPGRHRSEPPGSFEWDMMIDGLRIRNSLKGIEQAYLPIGGLHGIIWIARTTLHSFFWKCACGTLYHEASSLHQLKYDTMTSSTCRSSTFQECRGRHSIAYSSTQ